MLCWKCDTRNPDDATFCANCGSRIAATPPPAVPATGSFAPQPPRTKKRRLMRTCLITSAALFALVVACAGLTAAIEGGDGPAAAVEKRAAVEAGEDELAEATATACGDIGRSRRRD